MIHSLICNRIGHEDRYPDLSRDWEDIDCRATGCMFNINQKCATPSRAKIGCSGKCEGFTVRQTPKVSGD